MRHLCRIMAVHPSGYYAWRRNALSERARDDQRLMGLIKHAWLESGGVYGYRKIHQDLREAGETCGKHRVARLMRRERLRSQTGYRRRPGAYGGKPAVVSPNRLDRRFDVTAPNVAWVTDITYIRTHEGWLWSSTVRTALHPEPDGCLEDPGRFNRDDRYGLSPSGTAKQPRLIPKVPNR